MPPKRKSRAPDDEESASISSLTDLEDADFSPPSTPPALPAAKRSRQNKAVSSGDKPLSSSAVAKNSNLPEPGSFISFQARPPTPGVSYSHQIKACQGYRNTPETFEKCVSCIEKQSILGGCRFVNLRAFKDISGGVKDNDHTIAEDEGVNKKKQGTKGFKKILPIQDHTVVDFKEFTFLSNQPEDYVPFSSLNYAPPIQEISPPTETKSKKKSRAQSPPNRTRRSTRNTNAISYIEPTEEKITQPPSASPVIDNPNQIPTDTPSSLLKKQSIYSLSLIAPIFVSQLLREKSHEDIHLGQPIGTSTAHNSKSWKAHPRPIARIVPTPEARSMCDFCATTIFLGSYLCGCCGREYCLGCWEEWKPSPNEPFNLREKTISSCSRRRRHCRDSMFFITRAGIGEIDSLLPRVQEYANKSTKDRNIPPPLDPIPTESPVSDVASTEPPTSTEPQHDLDATVEASPPVPPPSPPPTQLPEFLPLPKISCDQLSLDLFQSHWLHSSGVPLVVTNLLDRFSLTWDDTYFITHYGQEPCILYDTSLPNPDLHPIQGTVADFFQGLNQALLHHNGKPLKLGSWKLKDWPPQADFSEVFPELYNDFERAVPSPDYARRLGWLNLASRGPKGWVRPDLGPKMYCAYPAVDFIPKDPPPRPGKKVIVKGTTNLHLDMTDAVNIMVYTSPLPQPIPTHFRPAPPSSRPIGAIWDIFPPTTAGKIRQYLRNKHPDSLIDDPIHRQVYYLDERDLVELAGEEWKVRSWRIYQEPGEAVYIPAGCPHQVRNVRGGVKVAVDFLSPENVGVCKVLLEEGRRLAGVGAGGGEGAGEREEGEEEQKEKEEKEQEKEKVGDGDGDVAMKDAKQTEQKVKSLGKREDVLQLWNCLYHSWAIMEKVVSNP